MVVARLQGRCVPCASAEVGFHSITSQEAKEGDVGTPGGCLRWEPPVSGKDKEGQGTGQQ